MVEEESPRRPLALPYILAQACILLAITSVVEGFPLIFKKCGGNLIPWLKVAPKPKLEWKSCRASPRSPAHSDDPYFHCLQPVWLMALSERHLQSLMFKSLSIFAHCYTSSTGTKYSLLGSYLLTRTHTTVLDCVFWSTIQLVSPLAYFGSQLGLPTGLSVLEGLATGGNNLKAPSVEKGIHIWSTSRSSHSIFRGWEVESI